jgi:adenine-specific DNA-methyltransferase
VDTKGHAEADQPEKFDLGSLDVAKQRRDDLLRLFPEVRTEGGKLDFERLKLALGETVDVGKERYGMNWPGKADCFRSIQAPSLGTLRPSPEESVAFDTTENLIIEGDNLEVLKLLQKSYLGKVKMIYIDPPYNTGNDFIYPDNYTESLQTYLEFTGQVDAEGRRFGTNTDTDGRFHSKWLNMMYPRLYLARNLLREDGVIFISIDDNEVDNLRRLCDEVFGEENFVAALVWEKGRKNDAKFFSVGHEYMLVFARSKQLLREMGVAWREEKPGARDIWDKYLELRNTFGVDDLAVETRLRTWFRHLPNGHPAKKWARYARVDQNGPWRDRDISWPGGGGPRYDVVHPTTGKPCRIPESGWRYSSAEAMQAMVDAGLVVFREDETEPPFRKAHLRPVLVDGLDLEDSDVEADEDGADNLAAQVRGSYLYKQSQVAVRHLRDLMGDAKVFDNSKDHEELARLVAYVLGEAKNDIVLDFFAGSGAIAESVLQVNKQTGSEHRFILVQLPEPTGRGDYPTIADITKERVRRVIAKLNKEDEGKLDLSDGVAQDRGFRVFKLAESNFKPWNAQVAHDAQALEEQLDLHVDHVREGRSNEDLLYEILLKSGFPLATPVDSVAMAGKTVHAVAGGALFICLERELTLEVVRTMAGSRPERVVCLDEGFAGNDQLKANAVQIFKTAGVTSFKTV